MFSHAISGQFRSMSKISAIALLAALSAAQVQAQDIPASANVQTGNNDLFRTRILTTGLSNPWEVTMGPNDKLWVTERSSGEVTWVDTFTGEQQTILMLDDFITDVQHQGLLGMALHPELMKGTGNDYVYLVYTYNIGTEEEPESRARLARYTFDPITETLVDPVALIEDIPAGNDHNAGRIKVTPDGQHIIYTIGEQGANYGGNYQKPNHAQLLPTAEQIAAKDYVSYSGKVLRLNLDGSIPEDNPEIEGVKSHILTYGHRNPQGLTFGPTGIAYVSEHGPDSDDEINILQPGGNYGWPNVAGYKDDQAYVFADWSKSEPGQRYTGRSDFPDNVPQHKESDFKKDMVDPIKTFFTVTNDFDFTANCGWICNPTVGPSSIAYYAAGADGIAEWDNTLLMPTLKHGIVYAQKLSEDGTKAVGDPVAYFSTQNRYRDIEIVGKQVFIATDGFSTAGQKYGSTGFTNVLHNPGAIMLFDYVGENGKGGGLTYSPLGGEKGEVAAAAPAAQTAAADMDYDTLYKAGATLFGTTCAACHGRDGEGKQGPAFADNEGLVGEGDYLASTVLHGFGYMPAFEKKLDDAKIAAILTYIRNSWGNKAGVLQPSEVAAQR